MTGESLESFVLQYVPESFLRAAVQAVFLSHRVAFEECAVGFAETEAENLRPYYRRAKLEGYLRDAADIAPGLSADVVQGEGNNWWHTEVRGGPIVLTQSAVPGPCQLPEKTTVRLGLAAGTIANSGQGSLFPEEETPQEGPVYGLLLHSRSRWAKREDQLRFGHLPESAYLAFPSADLSYYAHDINLFERFPDVVAAHLPETWDTDATVRYMRRARKVAFG